MRLPQPHVWRRRLARRAARAGGIGILIAFLKKIRRCKTSQQQKWNKRRHTSQESGCKSWIILVWRMQTVVRQSQNVNLPE